VRNRIAEAAFQFTRVLAAGKIAGLENYKVNQVQYGKNPRSTDYPVTDRLLEAFRAFVKVDTASHLSPAQLDEELDFVKLRLREEIITAAFSLDAGARVLVDSDPQVLRALEALPDAKRLAESVRQGPSRGLK
jgi:carboxyl-terminal processing protease